MAIDNGCLLGVSGEGVGVEGQRDGGGMVSD